jgi:ABC-type glycerol-3-phosphate transport system permease component
MSSLANAPNPRCRPAAKPGAREKRFGPSFHPKLVTIHSMLVLLCILTLFPLFWMLSTAFKGPQEIFAPDLRLVPTRPTIENFPEAFRLQPVGWWFLNSVAISVAIIFGKLAVSVPAAYAFARFRFPGCNVLFALVVGTMIVPDIITIVPNYILVSQLGWINTPQGVVIPSVAFTGFYVFLLRQAMLALPQEILDAARVDGANTWTTLWHIVLPLVRPAVAVVAVLSFLQAWNLYLWPLLVLSDSRAKTLTVGMQLFASNQESLQQWGPLMATALIALLPPLVLYVVAQKAIVSAFVTSGLK